MFRTLLIFSAFFCGGFGLKPVVLWHGLGDTCCNPRSLGALTNFMKLVEPNIYVHSLKIGNSFTESLNGFIMNVNDQVKMACQIIANDPKLKDGYNAIGFSQGGQFLRAVAQRCPNPPMHNLITIGSQHQGVYGIPSFINSQLLKNSLRAIINFGAYCSLIQNHVVLAEYWHDPLNNERYKAGSIFLADINQEKTFNPSYKENLLKINKFVMVKFLNDHMVIPIESEWFGFYTQGQSKEITKLVDSDLYKKDLLGLQQMNNESRLIFLALEGDHLQYRFDWFYQTIMKNYLLD